MDPPLEATRMQILVFVLDEALYALQLGAVQRVVRAAEITALPGGPAAVLGVIDYRGDVIPVVDIRRRLELPWRMFGLNDRFIIADTSRRRLALIADSVMGLHELKDRDLTDATRLLPGALFVQGVAAVKGDLVLICDLDRFLGLDDERQLDELLAKDTQDPQSGTSESLEE